jgi:peptidoglycan/LPS O-acetylase OafA/YrhL
MTKPVDNRVRGLDSLRFFMALWVVISHLGFLSLPAAIDKSTTLGFIIIGTYNNAFCAPAAVIVFFVISGFCIQYPYRNRAIPLKAFFVRRYIRILLPMAASLALALLVGLKVGDLNDSILWSLICEEIYYAIYPLLLLLQSRIGWGALIWSSAVISIGVALTDPAAGDYPSYGWLNWLLALPCWLMGCYLAATLDRPAPTVSSSCIWRWRIGIWMLSVICSVLRFHSFVAYPWTLNLFAIVAMFWLRREIAYYHTGRPSSIFEQAGKWSYSLYLVHLTAAQLLVLIGFQLVNPNLQTIIRLAFVLLICFLFYKVVEQPSHALARFTARKFQPDG